ncbi:MAG TPA: hypothetical protein DCL73_13130 [Treponema sp.]|nr:hypothetical protein [Treponema sp.]
MKNEMMHPADIMCVKADGTVLGLHTPSMELPFHRSVYRMRPDVKTVFHAHPPAVITFRVYPPGVPPASVHERAGNVFGFFVRRFVHHYARG